VLLVLEELGRDHGTDQVRAHAAGIWTAAAVPEEPGHGLHAAGFEGFAEHVAFAHDVSIATHAGTGNADRRGRPWPA
jgi:hypothetical protein